MALEEVRSVQIASSKSARGSLPRCCEEIDPELLAQFAAYDAGAGRSDTEKIRAILNRRKYIHNLVNQVERL